MHEKKKLVERGKYHLSWALNLCWTSIPSIVRAGRSNLTKSSVNKYSTSEKAVAGCIPGKQSFDRDWRSTLAMFGEHQVGFSFNEMLYLDLVTNATEKQLAV